MGFLDALGPLLTSASTAVGAYRQGQQQAEQQKQKDLMTIIQMRHQQQQDADAAAMRAVQADNLKSLIEDRRQKAESNLRAFGGLKNAGQVTGDFDPGTD